MMRALSGGLALKATRICGWMTTTIRPHRIRKTSIRTRKMRGEETLNGSMSRAIAGLFVAETPCFVNFAPGNPYDMKNCHIRTRAKPM